MVIACWSVKGGSGTSVVAAALALKLARSSPPVLLADLAGDLPAVLGRPDPLGPGLAGWLGAGPDVASDAFDRIALAATPGLRLLPWCGEGSSGPVGSGRRLVDALSATSAHAVVIDCGSAGGPLTFEVAAAAPRSLLVIRPCFLALRRALAAPRPSGVVLVSEPERVLRAADVEDVLGVPVVANVGWDASVARAVDAGLLGARLPRPLEKALGSAA